MELDFSCTPLELLWALYVRRPFYFCWYQTLFMMRRCGLLGLLSAYSRASWPCRSFPLSSMEASGECPGDGRTGVAFDIRSFLALHWELVF